jgi:hypothetical protein
MILMGLSRLDQAIPSLIEALETAVTGEFTDLGSLAVAPLRQAYAQDPYEVARIWHQITNSDPPDWLTQ